MPTLAFKQRFVAPIVGGTKRQTLRKASSIKPGDVIVCTCRWGDPPFARLVCTDVEEVRLGALRKADAVADGFASLPELVEFLESTYGSVPKTMTRISFELDAAG